MAYLPPSPDVMLEFAKRPPGAPRCPHCGARFQWSFSGGMVVEQTCACGARTTGRRIGIDDVSLFGANDETSPQSPHTRPPVLLQPQLAE